MAFVHFIALYLQSHKTKGHQWTAVLINLINNIESFFAIIMFLHLSAFSELPLKYLALNIIVLSASWTRVNMIKQVKKKVTKLTKTKYKIALKLLFTPQAIKRQFDLDLQLQYDWEISTDSWKKGTV